MLNNFFFRLFFGLNLFLIGLALPASAADEILFGPFEITIPESGAFHEVYELPHQIAGGKNSSGHIVFSKKTPEKLISRGFYRLDKKNKEIKKSGKKLNLFLESSKLSYAPKIIPQRANYLTIYLEGEPGAKLDVLVIGDLPVALDDSAVTLEDNAVNIPNVLSNDLSSGKLFGYVRNEGGKDPANTQRPTYHPRIASHNQPGHGSVADNGEGDFTYTPEENYNGLDSFAYTVTDDSGNTDSAEVHIEITPVNDAPVAHDMEITTDEDVNVSITLNGSDVDGDSLTFEITTQPGSGALTGTPPHLTYGPEPNYYGGDSFTYKVGDGELESDITTVNLTILPVNDPPVADAGKNGTVFRTEIVQLDGSGSWDLEDDNLTFNWKMISSPAGSSSVLADAALINPSFVPDTVGSYSFSLVVNDGELDSAPSTITITVLPLRVTVPDLSGLDRETAEEVIETSGLVSGSVTTSYSDTITRGLVITQDLTPGTTVEEGTKVHFIVSLGPEPVEPVVSFDAAPVKIAVGESATLSWETVNAYSVHIDNGVGAVALSGTVSVNPETTTTYTLTASGEKGNTGAEVTVAVTGDPLPQPAVSFGAKYDDLTPADATLEQYDPKRFALITGRVMDSGNASLSGVSVTIHGHPEYGTVLTDGNGEYIIPVEGGGSLTMVYRKDGFITAHRQVDTPWNDFAVIETFRLIPEDEKSTTIIFDGNPSTTITHTSSKVVDEFGSRSATMVFSGDNYAYALDENGTRIETLTTITTRATEFKTRDSMPAVLPPNSAYTYCAELQVDGVKRVAFTKPVITYVDNFLGFEVGEVVPAGYYDRDRGVWVPSDNGVVVRLLDTDGDGVTDALDNDGDDAPDDLDGDGSFKDEVSGLDDPSRYIPGDTFWRVEVSHFTPWDFNWPFGPPWDAVPPNAEAPPYVDQPDDEVPDDNQCINSYVKRRSRVFHEDIPLPGLDMTLHYASNRTDGYRQVISVPASGDAVPNSLKRIIVELEVAGRTFKKVLDPLPDQKAHFVWDGLDILGRKVSESVEAHVKIGFVYQAVYVGSGNVYKAFARAGNEVTGIRARQEVTSWRRQDLKVPGKGVTLGEGWTLSGHHTMDLNNIFYKGDGTLLKRNDPTINTVAGNGKSGYGGVGGPATKAVVGAPTGVTVDSRGNFYFASFSHHTAWKVDTNGTITIAAGQGWCSINGAYRGDGGPATKARLHHPHKVAVDNSGNLYIADTDNRCIRKVDTEGIITTVAGTGYGGYSGDGGPATEAKLSRIVGIDVDTGGNLYIADTINHRIRKVGSDGIITTVAGTGARGFRGDGGPATKARLYFPQDVDVDSQGNLYIADTWNNRIRKVDTSGVITTVAGRRGRAFSGDGGPATEAHLNRPQGIDVDSEGILYIADTNNHRIRKVYTSGIITTVAGKSYGYSGDGGLAIEAELFDPLDVEVDSQGNMYIADYWNKRVRKVSPASSILAAYWADGEIPVADNNGLGYIMSYAKLHKKTVNLNTGTVLREFSYNDADQLIGITDQFGNRTVIERDAYGMPIAIISPEGLRTELFIDADNHLTRITYPDNSFYDFTYTTDGLMTEETEPNGNRFHHDFDENGRLIKASDEEGGLWQYARELLDSGDIRIDSLTAEGRLTTIFDHYYSTGAYTSEIIGPNGDKTGYSRSSDGLTVDKYLPCGMTYKVKYGLDPEYKYKFVKKTTTTTPSGLSRESSYDRVYEDTDGDKIPDLITRNVNTNNRITTFTHDVLEASRIVMSPEGRIYTEKYDPETLLTTKRSISGFYDTLYNYDEKGRLEAVATGSRSATFSYNSKGFLQSITDPMGRTTSYTHDAMGRVLSSRRPDNSAVYFDYDPNGNLTVLTTPTSVDHSFAYNRINRNSAYQAPLSGTYSFVYDKDRRLVQSNLPSGRMITNIYDKDRLTRIQTPEGNIDFDYFCSVKLKSMTKGGESISYEYDGSLETGMTLSGTVNRSLAFDYDNDFNLAGISYAGITENISHDGDGLLNGIGRFTVTRNVNNGLPESVSDGSLTISRSFNGYGETAGQSAAIGSNTVAAWSLTRNSSGRITGKTETVNGSTDEYSYTYDKLGRLLTVTRNGNLEEEYRYNDNGARTYEYNSRRGITGRSFSYSIEDHLIEAGDMTYQYTVDGFLANKKSEGKTTYYDYSSRGELLSVNFPDGDVIEYVHDPMGRRIAKKVNGTITRKYLWLDRTTLLAVYDGSDSLLMRFEYADGRMPAAMTRGGATYYLHYDQVGSLRLVTDAYGNAVKEITFDSFGNILSDSNPDFTVPFGFAGGLHDRDTGLVRFGARDYDPAIGRWTAKDPIFFAGGDTNLFGYVSNDPVNFIDPLGLASLTTDMENQTTTFDPRPEDPNGSQFSIRTRNDVTRSARTGANDPFTTRDVSLVPFTSNPKAYGPSGTYIDTGDPRGRDIHGGGSCAEDPKAPEQGWCKTLGCTRGQNLELLKMYLRIEDFKARHPGVRIPYSRK